jgi:hypothetical protein
MSKDHRKYKNLPGKRADHNDCLADVKRFFTTGCGRSGNTLLHFLCDTGFKNTFKTNDEHVPTEPLTELGVPIEENLEWILFKDPKYIATDPVPEEVRLREFLALLDNHPVYAACMMRDPRGALLSRNPMYRPHIYQNQPSFWIRAAKAIQQLRFHKKVIVLRYEDLLGNSDYIQQQMMYKFGFKLRLPFSRCWKEFDKNDSGSIKAMHGARPIDPSRAKPWKIALRENRDHLRRMFAQKPEMVPLMESFGYVFDGFGD